MALRVGDEVVFSSGWTVTYRVVAKTWERLPNEARPYQVVDIMQITGPRTGRVLQRVMAISLTKIGSENSEPERRAT